MITEHDLREAIAECQGERNPNANTCIKLAAYYTILEQMEKKPSSDEPVYSGGYSAKSVLLDTDTEFAEIINQVGDSAWLLMDELMTTLSVVNPRLYAMVMRRLRDRD